MSYFMVILGLCISFFMHRFVFKFSLGGRQLVPLGLVNSNHITTGVPRMWLGIFPKGAKINITITKKSKK